LRALPFAVSGLPSICDFLSPVDLPCQTPNIHLCSIKDFPQLCGVAGAEMGRGGGAQCLGASHAAEMPWWFWNLFSEQAVFLLSRRA
jgi:hypothetical protein